MAAGSVVGGYMGSGSVCKGAEIREGVGQGVKRASFAHFPWEPNGEHPLSKLEGKG